MITKPFVAIVPLYCRSGWDQSQADEEAIWGKTKACKGERREDRGE